MSKPIIKLAPGYTSPSYETTAHYTLSNLPGIGGQITLYAGANCDTYVDSVNTNTETYIVSLSSLPVGTTYFSVKVSMMNTQYTSSCVSKSYEVLAPPVVSGVTYSGPASSDLSAISIAVNIPPYLILNIYSDSSCSTKLSSSSLSGTAQTNWVISDLPIGNNRLYFSLENEESVESSCSSSYVDYERSPPMPPTSISLNTSSPNDEASISINLSGGSVKAGMTVQVYSDNLCTILLSSKSVSSTDVDVTISSIIPGSTTNFYATIISSSTESSCSSATTSYVRNPLEQPILSYNVGSSSPSKKSKFEILLSNVVIGNTILIYADSSCLNLLESTSIDNNVINLEIGVQDTSYTLYAKQKDSAGYESACSSSSLNFIYNHLSHSKLLLSGYDPKYIAKGDFNNDGNLDIAVASATSIETMLGVGDGSFNNYISFPDEDGTTAASSLSIGDINKDGYDDIVAGTYNKLNYFESNGDGTFKAVVSTTINFIDRVKIADMNNDGNLDIVIGKSSGVEVFHGNGNGSFSSTYFITTKGTQKDLDIADLDGDGDMDIAVTQFFAHEIAIIKNNGAGFEQASYYASGNKPESFGLIDYDKDGDLDLAIAGQSNDINVMVNAGDGTFSLGVLLPMTRSMNYTFDVLIVDFNNDGNNDILVSHNASNESSLIYGNGDGTFSTENLYGQTGSPRESVSGDFNGDGKDDIIFTNAISSNDKELLIAIQ